MAESLETMEPELRAKLDKALDRVLGNEVKYKDAFKADPLTQAEYDLRVEYVRLSWRLLKQTGPFNFEAQARELTRAMSLAVIAGDNEESFVKKITDTLVNAGLAPVAKADT